MDAKKREAVLQIITAIADAIRGAGKRGLPSGELYAVCMGHMTLDDYIAMIAKLKEIGLVKEENHLLTWIGPN